MFDYLVYLQCVQFFFVFVVIVLFVVDSYYSIDYFFLVRYGFFVVLFVIMKNEIFFYLEVLVIFMMGFFKLTEGVQVRKLFNSICLLFCQYIYWYIYINFDLQWVL